MMMIAPKSHARLKKGVLSGGGRKKRREIKEKENKKELRRQARTLLEVSYGQGYGMRGAGENMYGGVGLFSTRRAERSGG